MLVYLVGLGAILALIVFVGITFLFPSKDDAYKKRKKREAKALKAAKNKRRRP